MAKRIILTLSLIALTTSLLPALVQAEIIAFPSGNVENYGAPEHLIIEGCQTFTQADLRQALLGNWEVQLASSPSSSLRDYVGTIRRKLTYGYQAAGFPDVQVSVGAESNRDFVVASVVEGPRYVCGGIHVTGAKNVPVDQLIEKLKFSGESEVISGRTDGQDGTMYIGMDITKDKGSASWEEGEHADFDPYGKRRLQESVQSVLAGLGYFAAHVTVKTPIEDGKSVLNIEIASEGPHAMLESVTIDGLKKNRPQDVLAFLGVKNGQPISFADLGNMQLKLWHSARFKKHLISARSIEGKSKLVLHLDMEEYADAPPISEPLTPVEQAVLQCREWLLSRRAAGEDLVLTIDTDTPAGPGRAHACIGPAGFTASFRINPHAGSTTAPAVPADYFLAFAQSSARIYNFTSGRKVVGGLDHPIGIDVTLKLCYEVEKDGKTRPKFNVGAGMNTTDPTMKQHIDLAPVAFLELAHSDALQYEIHDGVLTAAGKKGRIRVETATGRLLECKFVADSAILEVTARRGALAEELAAAEKKLPGNNSLDPAHPAASAIAFVANEIVQLGLLVNHSPQPRQARISDAVRRMMSAEVLAPLDQVFATMSSSHDFFYVPSDPREVPGGNMLAFPILHFVLPVADRCFERGTWPWVLARQQVLILAGQMQTVGPEVDRIVASETMGPLGQLALARFLSPLAPPLAVRAAEHGLHLLDAASFHKDVTAILKGDNVAAGILRRAADALRRLPQEDVDALAEAMSEDRAKIFRRCATALRAHPQEPIEKVLAETIESLWTDLLRQAVVEGLNSFLPDEMKSRPNPAAASGDRQRTIAELTQVIERPDVSGEDLARALIERGARYTDLGQNEQAIADLTRALDRKNLNPAATAGALAIRGRAYSNSLQNDEAIADCTRALESPGISPQGRVNALLSRANASLHLGHFDDAIADCTRMLEIPETHPDQVTNALFIRGLAHMGLAQGDKALADETRAIETKDAAAKDVARALLARGNVYLKLGKANEAIADETRAIATKEAAPLDIARALLGRAEAYLALGKQDEALADHTRLIEMNGAPPALVAQALINRGVRYSALGQSDKEIADYSRLIDMNGVPAHQLVRAYFYRGITYASLKQSDKAIADYTRAIEMKGAAPADVLRVLLGRGDMYSKLGKPDEAIADVSRAMAMNAATPTEVAQALLIRAEAYSKRGNLNEALADNTRVIEMNGVAPRLLSQALMNRGVRYSELGELDKEIADYTHLIELKGAPSFQVAHALHYRGITYAKQKQTEKAIADYTRVIDMKDAPMEWVAPASLNRGTYYGSLGKNEAAIADFSRVIEAKGLSTEHLASALFGRGGRYGALGQMEKAIADYSRLIDLNGAPIRHVAAALCDRGYVYGKLSQTDKQIADYTRVIEMKDAPTDQVAIAFSSRGFACGRLKQIDKAIADTTRAIEIKDAPQPVVVSALVNRGWYRYGRAELDLALEDFRRALVLDPHKALAAYNMGLVLLRQGKPAEAKKSYEAALAADSPRGPAAATIEELVHLRDDFHGPAETTVILGWACLHAGQRDKGTVELRTYLHDHPDGPLAAWARQLLADPPTQ